MKYTTLIFIALLWTFLPASLQADPPRKLNWTRGQDWPEYHEILVKAFDATRKASYTVEVKNPDEWDPEVTSGKFYRRVEEDGFVLLRTELFKNGKPDTTFIRNRAGQFGINQHFRVQLDEVIILFIMDGLYTGFAEFEEQIGRLELAEGSYRGESCYKLTMTLPSKEPVLVGMLAHRGFSDLSDPNSLFYHIRPFVREFLIGKDNHLIYSRKHFNAFGKVIYHQTLGEIKSLAKPDLALFDTPEDINLVVPYRYDMVSMTPMASPELPPRPGIGDALAGRWNRFLNWIGSPAVINGFAVAFLILALSLLAVAAVFKIRYRRQLKAQASRGRRRRR